VVDTDQCVVRQPVAESGPRTKSTVRDQTLSSFPAPPQGADGEWTTLRGLFLTFGRPRQVNTGPLSASFFSGSSENRSIRRKSDPPDATDPAASATEAAYEAG